MIQRALGRPARIWRRPDGKPVCHGEEGISAAHAGDFTLALVGADGAACDLEEVAVRTETVWHDLLGAEKFDLAGRIADERVESLDTAATRLWTAMECLKKIGQPVASPLVLAANTPDGWTLLRSGPITISTCVAAVRGMKSPLGIAVASRSRTASPPAPGHPSVAGKPGV